MTPTWGDPVFTGGDESQGPAYEYFGLTSDDLTRTHTIDSTVPVPDCTANTNNYFVRSGLYFPSYDATALVSTLHGRRGQVSGRRRRHRLRRISVFQQAAEGLALPLSSR